VTTSQHLLYQRDSQHLPTSLVHAVKTVIHAPVELLLRFLVLHFAMALAGRLPPPPADEEGDRKLLVGRAEFTQAVKLPKARKKKAFEHDLELREVPYDKHSAIEFRHNPSTEPPPHALHGTILLVPGPHGTTTVQLVAVVGVAAAPTPATGARTGNTTQTTASAGTTGEDPPLLRPPPAPPLTPPPPLPPPPSYDGA
jgi:hypothetical protein